MGMNCPSRILSGYHCWYGRSFIVSSTKLCQSSGFGWTYANMWSLWHRWKFLLGRNQLWRQAVLASRGVDMGFPTTPRIGKLVNKQGTNSTWWTTVHAYTFLGLSPHWCSDFRYSQLYYYHPGDSCKTFIVADFTEVLHATSHKSCVKFWCACKLEFYWKYPQDNAWNYPCRNKPRHGQAFAQSLPSGTVFLFGIYW